MCFSSKFQKHEFIQKYIKEKSDELINSLKERIERDSKTGYSGRKRIKTCVDIDLQISDSNLGGEYDFEKMYGLKRLKDREVRTLTYYLCKNIKKTVKQSLPENPIAQIIYVTKFETFYDFSYLRSQPTIRINVIAKNESNKELSSW